MTFRERVKNFRASRKRYVVTLVLALIVLALGIYSYWQGKGKTDLVYADSLNLVAIEVNDVSLTLRDIAFYVAYEENQVEQQALAYDPEDTGKYWNMHADGTFIRIAARNAAVQMAIHDELFYQMAMEEKIELTEEEENSLRNYQNDFWADLVDEEKAEKLGVTREDIEGTMRKVAYAQKMQTVYAELQGREYEDYDFSADAYQELLEEQEYKINRKVWDRLTFGNITLEH